MSGADRPLRVSVDRIGAQADGLGRLADGTPCIIPGALPGEVVEAVLLPPRGGMARAEPRAILTPSADRVAPPCVHFGSCGGCALQHWADAPYAAWKRGRLVEALERAGFADAPVGPLMRTPPHSRRRADLALRGGAGGIRLGFHARGGAAVEDLTECTVMDPRLVALFQPLRALLKRLPALRREGSAVLNLLETGPDLLLRTDGPLEAPGRALLAAFARDHGVPRIAWARGDGPVEIAAQLGPVALRFGPATVVPQPGAFLQASPAGEAAIIAAVLAAVPVAKASRAPVVELYAGLGTLSFPLAARQRVVAYEGVAEAVAAVATAAGQAGVKLRAVRRDLDRQPVAPSELHNIASVVLDPPFAGAAEQVALLARARVPNVIYVSCNPVALARDTAVLAAAGYRVAAATPVDQFLWSPHLESVVHFQRGA